MEKRRKAYNILGGKYEGDTPLGRCRHRWEDNIKVDLKEIGLEGVDWVKIIHDTWAFVNTPMDFGFYKVKVISWPSEQHLVSHEELCYIYLVHLGLPNCLLSFLLRAK
jgi:hypothetical protein